jgi:hypothetical protein
MDKDYCIAAASPPGDAIGQCKKENNNFHHGGHPHLLRLRPSNKVQRLPYHQRILRTSPPIGFEWKDGRYARQADIQRCANIYRHRSARLVRILAQNKAKNGARRTYARDRSDHRTHDAHNTVPVLDQLAAEILTRDMSLTIQLQFRFQCLCVRLAALPECMHTGCRNRCLDKS